ncbi:unnamed protein product [Didymodactylos carnosus]|uniref:Uncharacterized protein n=1 Tax=Didymodactylos carnosus TaxID=1234261 RepID=A0A8S2RIF6_9BILA|nr:unnamed protein product [Didymodactylos carnosus]
MTNIEDTRDSIRLFTSYLYRKIIEHDLTADKLQFWKNRYPDHIQNISKLLNDIDITFDNLKNVVSAFEQLYALPNFTWIHSSIDIYCLICYNRDFDILKNKQEEQCDSSSIPFDNISSFIINIHDCLYKQKFHFNKLTTPLSKNTVVLQHLCSIISKTELKQDDCHTVFNQLFQLQLTNDKYKQLQTIPQLSFVYYILPFYDLRNNTFHVKQQSSIINLPSSTSLLSRVATTTSTFDTLSSCPISSSNLGSVTITSPRTIRSLPTVLNTDYKQQLPHSLPSSPQSSAIHIQENVLPSIANINRYESVSNDNLQQQHRPLSNDDNDPIELDRMDPPLSTNQQRSSTTQSPLQQSTSITSGPLPPVLTNILSPVHVPFSIFDPTFSINSATTTTSAYTTSISHLHEIRPQRLVSNKDIPFTNRRCPCSYCNTLSYSNDRRFIDTGCNTNSIDTSETVDFKVLNLKHKYDYIDKERPWFQMSTINIDQDPLTTTPRMVHSIQQTHLSSSSLSTMSSRKEDLPPEVVFRNELDRLKRYENHFAILNSHKERRSYPQTLSYMPKPSLGADDGNFLTEWNSILNHCRQQLIELTMKFINDQISVSKTKIESISCAIPHLKRFEIEGEIDKKLESFIENSWCKLIRHTINAKKSGKNSSPSSLSKNKLSLPDSSFPTINHFPPTKTTVTTTKRVYNNNNINQKNQDKKSRQSRKIHFNQNAQQVSRSTSTSLNRQQQSSDKNQQQLQTKTASVNRRQQSSGTTNSFPSRQDRSSYNRRNNNHYYNNDYSYNYPSYSFDRYRSTYYPSYYNNEYDNNNSFYYYRSSYYPRYRRLQQQYRNNRSFINNRFKLNSSNYPYYDYANNNNSNTEHQQCNYLPSNSLGLNSINQQPPQSYSNQHSNFFQQDSKNLYQQYPQPIRYPHTAATPTVQSLAPQQYLIQPSPTYYQPQIPQTTY